MTETVGGPAAVRYQTKPIFTSILPVEVSIICVTHVKNLLDVVVHQCRQRKNNQNWVC